MGKSKVSSIGEKFVIEILIDLSGLQMLDRSLGTSAEFGKCIYGLGETKKWVLDIRGLLCRKKSCTQQSVIVNQRSHVQQKKRSDVGDMSGNWSCV